MNRIKKIGIGVSIAITVFLTFGFTSAALTDEETKQRWGEEREEEKQQEKIAQEKEDQIKLQQEIQRLGNDSFTDAKIILDNYLQSVRKSTIECDKVPNSVQFSAHTEKEMDEIIVNSTLMVLLIEEVEEKGYNGLSSYKQKIINDVDKLTECINRH